MTRLLCFAGLSVTMLLVSGTRPASAGNRYVVHAGVAHRNFVAADGFVCPKWWIGYPAVLTTPTSLEAIAWSRCGMPRRGRQWVYPCPVQEARYSDYWQIGVSNRLPPADAPQPATGPVPAEDVQTETPAPSQLPQ